MKIPVWLKPPNLIQSEQRTSARLLFGLILLIVVTEVALLISSPWINPDNWLSLVVFASLAFVYTTAAFFLLQAGRIKVSSLMVCGLLGGMVFGTTLLANGLANPVIFLYTVVILLVGLLLGGAYSLLFGIIGALAAVGLFLMAQSGLIPSAEESSPSTIQFIVSFIVFLASGILFTSISRNYERALDNARNDGAELETRNEQIQHSLSMLAEKADGHANQLRLSSEIEQILSRVFDQDSLGNSLVDKLTKFLECESVGIFMADPSQQTAVLKYFSGDLQILPESSRRLDIRPLSPLGTAIRFRTPYSLNLSDHAHPAPPWITNSQVKSAVALPLTSGGRVIGILTLQALDPGVFDPYLEALARIESQISLAIENARMNTLIKSQSEEINRLNQFYFQSTWRKVLAQAVPAYRFSDGKVSESQQPDFAALETATKERTVQINSSEGVHSLIAPVLYQDEVLGVITLNSKDRNWTQDEINLVESVLHQTALSLENSRLLIETRNRAEQEKLLSEISNRMRETLDIETILQTTAREMQKALHLSEVEVRLVPEITPNQETPDG